MWYVVQVVGGQERVVFRQIKQLIDPTAYKACVIPQFELKKKYGNTWKYKKEVLFPGYVFVETKIPSFFQSELRKINRMTKILRDGNENFIPLTDEDKTIINAFAGNDDYVMKMSEGIIEGEKIIILKGPLMGYSGFVKKIDRHKKIAYLTISMFGRNITLKAGLEIVKKI